MGILDLLQGAVGAGVQARSAAQQAEMQGMPLLIQLQSALAQRERQARQDALEERYRNAEIEHMQRPDLKPLVGADGTVTFYDPSKPQLPPGFKEKTTPDPVATHAANREFDVKHPLPQPQTNVYLPSVDPTTGQTTYTVVPHSGPVNPQATGIVKPVGSGGASGSQAPVGDMEQRFGEIQQHAKNVASGKLKIGRAMQAREGMAYGIANQSAGGHGVPLGQAIASGAMDMLGMGSGPDYEEYQALMNSTRAFGDDAAKVFKGRQNEDAVKREIALSQLTPDDYKNPTVVQQKLDRMRHIIELAKQTMPGGSPAAAAHQAPITKGGIGRPKGGGAFDDLVPQ